MPCAWGFESLHPHEIISAALVELVDTHDSKSCAAMREGSTPSGGTQESEYD